MSSEAVPCTVLYNFCVHMTNTWTILRLVTPFLLNNWQLLRNRKSFLIYATVCQGVYTHYICSANKCYFSCRIWMLTRKSPFSCKARICVFKLCRAVLNSVFKPISGVYSMHIWNLHKIIKIYLSRDMYFVNCLSVSNNLKSKLLKKEKCTF